MPVRADAFYWIWMSLLPPSMLWNNSYIVPRGIVILDRAMFEVCKSRWTSTSDKCGISTPQCCKWDSRLTCSEWSSHTIVGQCRVRQEGSYYHDGQRCSVREQLDGEQGNARLTKSWAGTRQRLTIWHPECSRHCSGRIVKERNGLRTHYKPMSSWYMIKTNGAVSNYGRRNQWKGATISSTTQPHHHDQ